MKWTRKTFKEHFGEDPTDMLGQDWEAILEDFNEEPKMKRSEFLLGLHGNGLPKMGGVR